MSFAFRGRTPAISEMPASYADAASRSSGSDKGIKPVVYAVLTLVGFILAAAAAIALRVAAWVPGLSG